MSFFAVAKRTLFQKVSLIAVAVCVLGNIPRNQNTSTLTNMLVSFFVLLVLLCVEFYQVYQTRKSFKIEQIPFFSQVGKIAVFHLKLLIGVVVVLLLYWFGLKVFGASIFSLGLIKSAILGGFVFTFFFLAYLLGTAMVIQFSSSSLSFVQWRKNLLAHGFFCILFFLVFMALTISQSFLDLLPIFIESVPEWIIFPSKIVLATILYFLKVAYLVYLSIKVQM